jgi:uncharacterized protein (TIGR00661 family)
MKILYAIQGTGNGHLSRARDIIPVLQKKGDLDILVSGIQADVELPYEVKYRFNGLSFIFGKNGGVNIAETYRKSNLKNLLKEINSLPVEKYDIVINDFEPVSAWACRNKHKPCIGLSHQAAVINKNAPKPEKKDAVGNAVLRYYAPVSVSYGFHFKNYDNNIFTPVIRNEIRNMIPSDKKHYTVYLPAYDDKHIIKILSIFDKVKWEVFSKHNKKKFTQDNITIQPINNTAFIKSMASAAGVLCGAGFETPAEVMYMEKKLMVIPMKGQYEQQCNAAALKEMGVPVIKSLKKKHLAKIDAWLNDDTIISVDYENNTEEIIDMIFKNYPVLLRANKAVIGEAVTSAKKLKTFSLSKIFS